MLLNIEQGDAVLFFSDHRSVFGDTFFKYFTKMGEEYPFYLITILCGFISFRLMIITPLIGIVVSIISFLIKAFFSHPRPLQFFTDLELADQINFVEGVYVHSAATSFPSGHTMSAFALYSFLAFLVTRKHWAGILFFIVAFLVGISRVYLVQHFFQDIYLGAILGVLVATVIYHYYDLTNKKSSHWLNKSIPQLVKSIKRGRGDKMA